MVRFPPLVSGADAEVTENMNEEKNRLEGLVSQSNLKRQKLPERKQIQMKWPIINGRVALKLKINPSSNYC